MRRVSICLSMAGAMFSGMNAMAATFTVTTTADSGAGSLRAAIALANASAGNSINLSGVSGTIALASTLPQITQSMTITGPGASTLAISGNNAYQILNISSGAVAISGLTFANGSAHGSDAGAIFNGGGALTLTNSTFLGNYGNYGGAITSYGALTVVNCTFSGNSAENGGGAINTNVTLNVTNSTFSGNSTTAPFNPNNGGYGGGAILDFGTAMTVTNSTFSGNSSAGRGGVIYASGGGATLTANNNIFVGNSISSPSGGAGITALVATSNASYNLFYQNVDASGAEDDCNGCTSNTNMISGDPNLLPLDYYGGPTETMLPLPGSPAICAGNYADVPSGVTADQRGFSLMNSACSNGGVDVGAVQSAYVQVTNTNDSGAGSLRAAIIAVNASNYGGDIDFAAGVTGTVTLANALPTINQSLSIIGPGASNLTISGNNAYQIFQISSSSAVFISGLTLANGMTTGNGGAIFSDGSLTITKSAFSGNSAVYFGGAIANNGGMLTVVDSTFSGNYASSNGGAISSTGTVTVTDTTFSGNSGGYQAAGGAGAIYNTGTLTVTGSTFSGNSGNYGGAIYNFGSSVAANNIFTNNSSQYGRGAGILDDKGTVNASHNLYFQNLDAGITEDDCNGCATNTNALTGSDPLLAALGSYGGPTQTLLPQPGSSAICASSMSLVPGGITSDQRGFGRTTTYGGSTCVDLGAVQTDYTAVAFSSSSFSGIAHQIVNPGPVVTVTENGQNIGGVSVTLGYSGTGSPGGLGPAITVAGTGATFNSLTATSAAQGVLSVNMPITAPGNPVQPAALTASATLTVQLATQIITFVAPSSLTYGNAPITLTATGGASGNPVTFSLDATSTPGAATLSGNGLTITGVGTVVIDANQAAGNGYSAAAQVQQSVLVNPARLTITASSPTVAYGSAVPTITPIFGTFFNGDTSAVLTKQPICVTAYTPTSSVGSSPTTSCSGAMAANYTFTYINGSVIVNPAPTFAIAGGNASISIPPGATTGNTVPITVTPSNGFTGTVSLTCSISPVAASHPATCSLSPSSVTISGTAAQNSTLTISTTAAQVGASPTRKLLWPSAGTALALVVFVGLPRRRKSWLAMLSVLAFLIAVGMSGCGGSSSNRGSNGGNAGTTAGTYTITVAGSSGSASGTAATITLVVQ